MNKQKLFKQYISADELIKLLNLKFEGVQEEWLTTFYDEVKPPRLLDIGCWNATIPSKLRKYDENTVEINWHGVDVSIQLKDIIDENKENIPSNIKIIFKEWI